MLGFHVQHELSGKNAGRIIVSQFDWNGQVLTRASDIEFIFKFTHAEDGVEYSRAIRLLEITKSCPIKDVKIFTKLFNLVPTVQLCDDCIIARFAIPDGIHLDVKMERIPSQPDMLPVAR